MVPLLGVGQYRETVCTGACDEAGHPIRLYPVPLRYLPSGDQYKLWDWIEVPLEKNSADARPESFRLIDQTKIRRVGHLDTEPVKSWGARHNVIFRDPAWHFGCVQDLVAAEADRKTSLGVIKVGAIEKVSLQARSAAERREHDEKLKDLASQSDLFGYEQIDLEFFPYRIKVNWHCERMTGPNACPGHTMIVLDWGLGELGELGPSARNTFGS